MALSKGTLFDPVVVQDLMNKVKGHSSLAILADQTPLSFNGNKEFVFSFDSEVDVVAENGAKSHGGVSVTAKTIVPIKFEYGARVSDEFMYAAEEEQLQILMAFNDGFARKVARGLDIAAFHGINPRSGSASTVIGDNHFDHDVTQTVTFAAGSVDANIEAAIALVDANEYDCSGMAMAPACRSALAALTNANGKLYPELAWGNNPGTVNGLPIDVNSTVAFGTNTTDRAIVGDFANCFKWGYAKEIPLRVIEYGDPDNTGADLAGHNQVYLRAEIYLGWAIMDPLAFARIVTS